MTTSGNLHPYSGSNLEPFANLYGADLNGAVLTDANLTGANLTGANLSNANLDGVVSGGITGTPALPSGFILSHGYLVGPSANLFYAHLSDLSNSGLTGAYLDRAELEHADLTNANLTNAVLGTAVLGEGGHGLDLTNANLSNAVGLSSSLGTAFYNANTDFTGTGFDPVAAGWPLVPVPEPGTALLMGLGLAGLAGKGRRRNRS